MFKTTKTPETQRGIVLNFPQRISSAQDVLFGVHVEAHVAGSTADAEDIIKQLRTIAIANRTSDRLLRVTEAGDIVATQLRTSIYEMFALSIGCSLEVPPHSAGTEFTISEIDGRTTSDRAVYIERNGDRTALGCAIGKSVDLDGFPIVVTVCGNTMTDALVAAQHERDEPSDSWADGLGWRQNGAGPISALGA